MADCPNCGERLQTDGGSSEEGAAQSDGSWTDCRPSRRSMLALGGGAVAAGAGGFFVWETFFAAPSGEFAASEDPQTTLEEYVGALNQGDFESAEALLHSAVDADLKQQVPAGDAGASLITITIEESDVLERTDSRAVVSGEIAVEIPLQGTETQQGEMVLRKEDGVWKIYRDGFLEVGPE